MSNPIPPGDHRYVGGDFPDAFERAEKARSAGYPPSPHAVDGPLQVCSLTTRAKLARVTLFDALGAIARLEMQVFGQTAGCPQPVSGKDPGEIPPLSEHIESVEVLAGEIHGRLMQLAERL